MRNLLAVLLLLGLPSIAAAQQRVSAELSLAFVRDRGNLLAGYDDDGVTIAPAPRPPITAFLATSKVSAPLRSFVRLNLGAHATRDSLRLADTYVTASFGKLELWAGRHAPLFVDITPASLVLETAQQFDGAGLTLDSLPANIRIEAFGARMHHMGNTASPDLFAIHISAQPHPRLQVAVSRAAAVGGAGNSPLHLRDVPRILVGMGGGEHGETENQVASAEAHWVLPARFPIALYVEWAFDDLSGAFVQVPGIKAGTELKPFTARPDLLLRLQAVSFARHVFGNPPWYRHSALPWIENRSPLGYPLGGHGNEWWLQLGEQHPEWRANVGLFLRQRGEENIYAPAREGRSSGVLISASTRWKHGFESFADLYGENGTGWRETDAQFGVRWSY